MRSRVMRVHNDLWDVINNIYSKNKGEISRISITKRAAAMIKQNSGKSPKYVINYWPLSKKRVRVY